MTPAARNDLTIARWEASWQSGPPDERDLEQEERDREQADEDAEARGQLARDERE